jgi:hypothetical protein
MAELPPGFTLAAPAPATTDEAPQQPALPRGFRLAAPARVPQQPSTQPRLPAGFRLAEPAEEEKPSYLSEFTEPIYESGRRVMHGLHSAANRVERAIAETTGLGREAAARDTAALEQMDKEREAAQKARVAPPGVTSIRSLDDAARWALSVAGSTAGAVGEMVAIGIPRAVAVAALEGFEETKTKTGSTPRALASAAVEAAGQGAPLHLLGKAMRGTLPQIAASAAGMGGVGVGTEAAQRALRGDETMSAQQAIDVAAQGGVAGLLGGAGARALPTLTRKVRESDIGKSIERTVSPTTIDASSDAAATIIRARNGELAADTARAREQLEQYRKVMGALPEPDLVTVQQALQAGQTLDQIPGAGRFAFVHAIEGGDIASLPADQQPVARTLRKMLDDARTKIQSLGKGYLEKFYEDYFPHIWKDPHAAQAMQTAVAQGDQAFAGATSKTPLRPKSFLKKRSMETMADGLEAGLVPATSNPLDLALLKIREMDKFYYGTKMMEELKANGLVKFGGSRRDVPPGWVPLEGPEFTVFAPPAVAEHFAAYDPRIRAGLQRVADFLNVGIETPLASQDKLIRQKGYFGYTGGKAAPDTAVARFGGDEAVLMHEIGHQLDYKYGLSRYFGRDARAWRELGVLALERARGTQITPDYHAYLLKPTERIANLFHAYWHAPDLLRQVAPTAAAKLDRLLASQPQLKRVIDTVKPSVQLTGEIQREMFYGPRLMGRYYAPEPVQRVLKNYMSRGLMGQPLYDGMRQIGNSLNMAQLGMSGFHLLFTSGDAIASTTALAIDQAMRGDTITAAKTLARAPLSFATTPIRGHKLRKAYLDPQGATPEMRKMVEAVEAAGGRVRMEELHQATPAGSFTRAWRNGTMMQEAKEYLRQLPKSPVKTALAVATRALETTMAPMMEYLVPRQKLGVFYDMAADWMRRNPYASKPELREAMQTIWDSVDNRMGQMVYDNVFWNKTLKDAAFLSVRSVGWNLGTIRELGGGLVDWARYADAKTRKNVEAEWTQRMSYTIAMPFIAAVSGAVVGYFYGQTPQEPVDYFFPRTGRLTPTGVPERVSVPNYWKDVVEYAHAPGQTVMNKTNPSINLMAQAWNNRDFYGAQIYNPDDPAMKQVEQWASYIGQQFMPFSARGVKRQQKEGAGLEAYLSLIGINPAPFFITDPVRAKQYEQLRELPAMKKRMRAEAKRAAE